MGMENKKNNNHRIKTAERLTRLETRQDLIIKNQDAQYELLYGIKTQVDKWKGTFAVIATLGGLLGGGVISVICHVIFH